MPLASGSGRHGDAARAARLLLEAVRDESLARFDPDGDYVRRHIPELASLGTPHIHAPWRLPAARRRQLSYPEPLIAVARGYLQAPDGWPAGACRTGRKLSRGTDATSRSGKAS
jgi:deoxyribodipyrimidine photolyase